MSGLESPFPMNSVIPEFVSLVIDTDSPPWIWRVPSLLKVPDIVRLFPFVESVPELSVRSLEILVEVASVYVPPPVNDRFRKLVNLGGCMNLLHIQ